MLQLEIKKLDLEGLIEEREAIYKDIEGTERGFYFGLLTIMLGIVGLSILGLVVIAIGIFVTIGHYQYKKRAQNDLETLNQKINDLRNDIRKSTIKQLRATEFEGNLIDA